MGKYDFLREIEVFGIVVLQGLLTIPVSAAIKSIFDKVNYIDILFVSIYLARVNPEKQISY